MNDKGEIKNILIKCQDNVQSQEKLLKDLKTVYDNVPYEEFFREFTDLLRHPMTTVENFPATENILTFASRFIISFEKKKMNKEDSQAEDDDLDPFVLAMFDFLLKGTVRRAKAVRYRACYLLHKMLEDLGMEASISEDLFNNLQKALLDRMSDRYALVRVYAAHALSWLQEPANTRCPIIEAYIYHLDHDPNHFVRRAILSCIAVCPRSIPSVIGSIRDVKENIRKDAYVYLAEKVPVQMLTISQRIKLLTQGLNDRSERVQRTVKTKLLPTWMKSLENNVEKFLHSLDIQGSAEIGEQALRILFKSQEPAELIKNFELLDGNRVIPLEKLTCESVFHWRCLCQHIKSFDGPIAVDGFDELVCDLTPFSEYTKKYVLSIDEEWNIEKRLEHEFVSLQLLTLASEFDLADHGGRRSLLLAVKDLLVSPKTNLVLVKPLIFCYKKGEPNVQEFIQKLVEIVSEIRAPLTVEEYLLDSDVVHNNKMRIANIIVETNVLRDQLESAVARQDFAEAQKLKLKIAELDEQKVHLQENMLPQFQEVHAEKNDVRTLLKCLTISAEMLRTDIRALTPSLMTLRETVLLLGVKNEDPTVRNEAVLALGLFCLRSVDIASQDLVLFLQICQIDRETIRITALRAIFDILLYFGLDSFEADPVQPVQDDSSHAEGPSESQADTVPLGQAASNIMCILSSMLDSDIPEVRTFVAEGMAKLMFLGRIFSPQLFSRLILLWYSPITENDTYLRHCIGVFILEFSSAGRQRNNDCLEEAFMITLRTVFSSPPSSPLSQIDSWNVASFFTQLTSTHVARQKGSLQESTIHDRIAVEICNEILKDPNSSHVRILARILPSLELSQHNALMDLRVLACEILKEVKDKKTVKYVEKFATLVTSAIDAMSNCEPAAGNNSPVVEKSPDEDVTPNEHPHKNGTPISGAPFEASTSPQASGCVHSSLSAENSSQETVHAECAPDSGEDGSTNSTRHASPESSTSPVDSKELEGFFDASTTVRTRSQTARSSKNSEPAGKSRDHCHQKQKRRRC